MNNMVRSFSELRDEQLAFSGGKGGVLARLYQSGYPVPNGFVILPASFSGDELTPAAWSQVQEHLKRVSNGDGTTSFAVRSSALSEDSAQASFAGEFETVLDVHTNEAIWEAIHTVRRSRKTERVLAYSEAKGMEFDHEIAVVVQRLVPSDISGILFTADPVTGSNMKMSGNFIFGLGEALVSGEAEPYTFTLSRPKGAYEGAKALRPFAKRLFKLAIKLEKELGMPQDIEFAVADGKLHLLQSRPITTLVEYEPATGEWNSSHAGDYTWIGQEVLSDVMTPSSLSVFQSFHAFSLANTRGMGVIGGRIYMNLSLIASLMESFGKSKADTLEYIALTAASVPASIQIPKVPMTRWGLIAAMLPIQKELLPRQFRLKRQFKIEAVPAQCQRRQQLIKSARSAAALKAIWREEMFPLLNDILLVQDGLNEDYFNPYVSLKKELTKLIGEVSANDILSTVSDGSGQLASLGPLFGIARLAHGKISRDEYVLMAGHRPQRENELMVPRPYEDPDWLEKQLAEYHRNPIDLDGMMAKRVAEFESRWELLENKFPKKARKLKKKVDKIAAAIVRRELIRSELTRMLGLIREWFLRAGEMTKLGDDVFFLSYQEVLDVLSGERSTVDYIGARKETYAKLSALPPYPVVINGRFDPYEWAADPDRRSDVYDSHAPVAIDDSGTITGFPGSSGRVEGKIRFLPGPEHGYQLEQGEILLASTTNVGWTPVFPRASAVITDIGAPLSHAAIVARELGIPAVVGCGNATMRLHTGDRVIVDGGRGTVELVS